jgi:hypothetical protein
MNNISNIEEYKPHKVSEVICVFCGYRCIDVRPVGVLLKNLECGGCRRVGGVIETGEVMDENT